MNNNKPPKEPSLVRVFGLFTATLLVSGIMIGSGVFKKIIPMAQTGLSETWILTAWGVAGIITMLSALNMVGLASLTEESGGVYEYLRLSFGNFYSFLFGWTDFTIIGTASVAAIAFIFSQTINSLIPLPNPMQHWEQINISHVIYPFADSGIKILAISTIGLLTWVNMRGARQSGTLNNIVTLAKIGGILLLIIAGLFYTSPPLHQPGAFSEGVPSKLSGNIFFSAFFVAMLSVLWAFDGWLDISFITGEIKEPKRNVPLAIIIGVSIATGLYILVNYSYMNVLPLSQLAAVRNNDIGAAVVAKALTGSIGKTMIIVLIMLSVFGTLNAVILSHTRIYFRMAQEKYFFHKVASVHPIYRTPHIALIYTMAWSCLLVISGTFDMLTDMVIFANFIFYGLLSVAVVKMKANGMIKIKVIGYPLVQVIIILFSLTLVINTVVQHPKQSIVGMGLILTAIPFYYYFKSNDSQ